MREQPERVETHALATVRQLLRWGTAFLSDACVGSARLDAELLLGHILGWSREKLWLNEEVPVEVGRRKLFELALRRRAQREPVAYITGVREFWSLDFLVSPAVLVPRPETELVVETALGLMKLLEVSNSKVRILDLGTGSGVIAVSLAKEIGNVEIWATDLSPEALKVAEANAARHGVGEKIHFLKGDLFEPVRGARERFDIVVSNPPYVRRGEMENLPSEIRDWEPKLALDGGRDGLDFYRRISQEARPFLANGGLVLLEIGENMGSEVSRLFAQDGGYTEISVRRDYSGRDRVLSARRLFKVASEG